MKHTKLPWSYDEDECEIHADTMQDSGGDPAHICEMLGPNKKENAEVIIYAVSNITRIEKQRDQLLEVSKEIYEHWTRLKKAAPTVPNTMYDKLEQTIQSVEGEDDGL